MGLSNTGGSTTYVNVMRGRLVIRCQPEDPGAIRRINAAGNEVYEQHFDTLSGQIKDVYVHENDYGKDWCIRLDDRGEVFTLQLHQFSSISMGVLSRLPNVNLQESIKIKSYFVEEKTYLVIYQGGKKLPSAYTKEKPNGLPPMEQVNVNGKQSWDSSKRVLFLEQMVDTKIKPQLQPDSEAMTQEYDESEAAQFSPDNNDDLPF